MGDQCMRRSACFLVVSMLNPVVERHAVGFYIDPGEDSAESPRRHAHRPVTAMQGRQSHPQIDGLINRKNLLLSQPNSSQAYLLMRSCVFQRISSQWNPLCVEEFIVSPNWIMAEDAQNGGSLGFSLALSTSDAWGVSWLACVRGQPLLKTQVHVDPRLTINCIICQLNSPLTMPGLRNHWSIPLQTMCTWRPPRNYDLPIQQDSVSLARSKARTNTSQTAAPAV